MKTTILRAHALRPLPWAAAHRRRSRHHRRPPASSSFRQRGTTLVEVVMFILIVSTALSAVVGVLGFAGRYSADPLVQRQALAVAESLLQEVLSQPYTANDLDGGANAIGPESGETRTSTTRPFDHVDDYHGFTMSGIVNVDGTAIAGLESYAAQVSVATQALDNVPAGEGLLVTVTVTGPGNYSVSVAGFRARSAP
ncbi:MAG TPA: type II secretion system protein [Burkholderiaceae bacterium]|nr:type II secretion system protein [Burkholderiaceae bacterium]